MLQDGRLDGGGVGKGLERGEGGISGVGGVGGRVGSLEGGSDLPHRVGQKNKGPYASKRWDQKPLSSISKKKASGVKHLRICHCDHNVRVSSGRVKVNGKKKLDGHNVSFCKLKVEPAF